MKAVRLHDLIERVCRSSKGPGRRRAVRHRNHIVDTASQRRHVEHTPRTPRREVLGVQLHADGLELALHLTDHLDLMVATDSQLRRAAADAAWLMLIPQHHG